MLTDFEGVGKLVIILLTPNKSKMYQYFADFEQFEKRSSYFSDFERVGHDCFLDILLNPSYPCLSVKIFSFLYAMVALVFLKGLLITDRLELEKTKIHSQFLILRLHCWCNKEL